MKHVLVFALGSLALAGCMGTDTDLDSDEQTQVDDLAATATLTAKVPGMTVWFNTTATPEWRYETDVWVLHGRTSKNLNSAFSYASDDEYGEALVTSARKFEVIVDVASMAHLLEGNRIYVELTTTGATTRYFTSLQMAPRFARFSGSSKIFVQETMSPVWFGSRIVWRGKASTSAGVSGLSIAATEAVTEGVVSAGKDHRFDWTWPNLMLAANPPSDAVHFTASTSTGPVAKDAGIDLVVTDLQLSEGIPEQDFSCQEQVLACLQALPAGTLDTSSCGSGTAVQRCWWQLPKRAPSASEFAVGLSGHLGYWYGEHGQDVASSGGLPLLQAQAHVHVASVTEITDQADDPEGHDLTKFAVFSHPDVVFPGSDIVWFGAYDRQTGQLTSVYDFN